MYFGPPSLSSIHQSFIILIFPFFFAFLTIYICYQVYIYICFLHIIIIFFVLSDDTSWSSRYSIRPRSRNLWVGVSAGVHFLLISAAESVKTWVRKVQLLIDEVQECWTCILSCFSFTLFATFFFYFVFSSRFVEIFLAYSLFSLPYTMAFHQYSIYIYI